MHSAHCSDVLAVALEHFRRLHSHSVSNGLVAVHLVDIGCDCYYIESFVVGR